LCGRGLEGLQLMRKSLGGPFGDRGKMRFVPLRMYDGTEVPIRELADEAHAMAVNAWRSGSPFYAANYEWRAWQLQVFDRWGYAGEWPLHLFLWRFGVRRVGIVLFAVPAAALAVRRLFGTEADVESYVWSLGLLATFANGIAVMAAALTWNFLLSLGPFARLYQEQRLALDQALRLPTGADGWRAEPRPGGGWQLVPVESGEGAAEQPTGRSGAGLRSGRYAPRALLGNVGLCGRQPRLTRKCSRQTRPGRKLR
jgi:hypothetical protein